MTTYRPEVDGLRAVAVVPVILFHAGIHGFGGGFVGVDIFFVISGFLITKILVDEHRGGRFSIAAFYERRVRRLLPALLFVVVACLPMAALWMLPDDLKGFSDSLVALATFASNILFWRQSGYFDTASELKPLLHTWSLAVEEQFYVLFPLLLALAWRLGTRRLATLMLAAALLSLGLAEWGALNKPAAAFFLLPTRGWELLVGALTALACEHRDAGRALPAAAAQSLALLGGVLIAVSILWFDSATPFPGLHALVPTLGAALVLACATPAAGLGWLLARPALVGIGVVSYSAYLWHQPLLAFARLGRWGAADSLALRWALIATTLLLATLTWRFVETPFRTRRVCATRRGLFRAAGLALAAIAAVGVAGHRSDGFKSAFDPGQVARAAAVDALFAERERLVRAGTCQFNASTNPAGVRAFLDRWDCAADRGQPGLRTIPLIVTGDSHSADLVLSLKLNGVVPLQMGGAGCSLTPRYMTRDCRQIFDKLGVLARGSRYYEYVAIANRFDSEEELGPDEIREMVDYWQGLGKKLIFFTSMPDFPLYKASIAHAWPLRANLAMSRWSERPEIVDYLASRGVHVVHTAAFFCTLSPDCGYRDAGGDLLMADPDHLSRAGARRFGAVLLRGDDLFKGIVARAGGATASALVAAHS